MIFFLFSLFSSGSVYSATIAIGPTSAAVNQEIYNWADVSGESVSQMLYYVDGALSFGGANASSKRWIIQEKFTNAGLHTFEVYFIMSDSNVRHYAWTMEVYSPTYRLDRAVQYAETYAINHNPAYAFFQDNGDCTNFVSQILHEGGLFPMETGAHEWYYNSLLDYSHSWTVVTDFYSYIKDDKHIVYQSSSTSTPERLNGYATYMLPPLSQGDLIHYTWPDGGHHNAFVVGAAVDSVNQSWVDGVQPVVDYHSTNSQHITWTLITKNSNWAKTTMIHNRIKWNY
jgi:hypothetical protein